eukprot:GHVP01052816.1.p1 GENE.GHVP01052816.1~~GHVP01052816.1.p1  ORF type:complete len:976 (+),score=137.39 GHVP01052816.1:368-3295(+)
MHHKSISSIDLGLFITNNKRIYTPNYPKDIHELGSNIYVAFECGVVFSYTSIERSPDGFFHLDSCFQSFSFTNIQHNKMIVSAVDSLTTWDLSSGLCIIKTVKTSPPIIMRPSPNCKQIYCIYSEDPSTIYVLSIKTHHIEDKIKTTNIIKAPFLLLATENSIEIIYHNETNLVLSSLHSSIKSSILLTEDTQPPIKSITDENRSCFLLEKGVVYLRNIDESFEVHKIECFMRTIDVYIQSNRIYILTEKGVLIYREDNGRMSLEKKIRTPFIKKHGRLFKNTDDSISVLIDYTDHFKILEDDTLSSSSDVNWTFSDDNHISASFFFEEYVFIGYTTGLLEIWNKVSFLKGKGTREAVNAQKTPITSICVFRDTYRYIVLGDQIGRITIWVDSEDKTIERIQEIRIHNRKIEKILFIKDFLNEAILIFFSEDKTLSFFSIKRMAIMLYFPKSFSSITSIHWNSLDCTFLLSRQDGSGSLYQMKTGDLEREFLSTDDIINSFHSNIYIYSRESLRSIEEKRKSNIHFIQSTQSLTILRVPFSEILGLPTLEPLDREILQTIYNSLLTDYEQDIQFKICSPRMGDNFSYMKNGTREYKTYVFLLSFLLCEIIETPIIYVADPSFSCFFNIDMISNLRTRHLLIRLIKGVITALTPEDVVLGLKKWTQESKSNKTCSTAYFIVASIAFLRPKEVSQKITLKYLKSANMFASTDIKYPYNSMIFAEISKSTIKDKILDMNTSNVLTSLDMLIKSGDCLLIISDVLTKENTQKIIQKIQSDDSFERETSLKFLKILIRAGRLDNIRLLIETVLQMMQEIEEYNRIKPIISLLSIIPDGYPFVCISNDFVYIAITEHPQCIYEITENRKTLLNPQRLQKTDISTFSDNGSSLILLSSDERLVIVYEIEKDLMGLIKIVKLRYRASAQNIVISKTKDLPLCLCRKWKQNKRPSLVAYNIPDGIKCKLFIENRCVFKYIFKRE